MVPGMCMCVCPLGPSPGPQCVGVPTRERLRWHPAVGCGWGWLARKLVLSGFCLSELVSKFRHHLISLYIKFQAGMHELCFLIE